MFGYVIFTKEGESWLVVEFISTVSIEIPIMEDKLNNWLTQVKKIKSPSYSQTEKFATKFQHIEDKILRVICGDEQGVAVTSLHH
uniref:Uncharacterized protein n=1 Tax=Timema cristinae TaxID=61476 RepID=A0A7R9HBS1_TIMCR|nr:unnamed protein product [Timema cristinae]